MKENQVPEKDAMISRKTVKDLSGSGAFTMEGGSISGNSDKSGDCSSLI